MACGFQSLSRSLSQSSFLVGSSLRVVALRVRRRPVAYRPARFHPGGDGNSRGHVFRAVFLSSSRPPSAHRLIRPTARCSIRTSGQANSSRQGKTRQDGRADGGRLSLSAPSRIPAPYRPRPRLVPLVGRRGEERLVPVGLVPSSRRWYRSFPRPRSGARHGLGSAPQPSRQASRQGRPVPVPPLVSAGGKPSANAPRIGRRGVHRAPSSARRTSKTAAVLIPSARLGPVPPIVSAPWLALGSAVNIWN